MKKINYLLALLLFPLLFQAQEIKESDSNETKTASTKKEKEWNNRISFFVGAGMSMIGNKIYEIPVIDNTTNNVIIEEAGKIKPSVSMGIVYTPFVYEVKRKVNFRDTDGFIKTEYIKEQIPKNLSIALFINPVDITTANSIKSNLFDLGFGLGWRSDNFSIFATMEFSELKQPKSHFIEKYKNNSTQYIINEEVQNAIDINDSSIFKDQIMSSFGIKLAYTFDIVNRYSGTLR